MNRCCPRLRAVAIPCPGRRQVARVGRTKTLRSLRCPAKGFRASHALARPVQMDVSPVGRSRLAEVHARLANTELETTAGTSRPVLILHAPEP
jgi:hypothetical protein